MKKGKVKKRKIKQAKRRTAPEIQQKRQQLVHPDGMERMTQAERNRAEAKAYQEQRKREQAVRQDRSMQSVRPDMSERKKANSVRLGEQRAREMEQLLDDIPSAEQKNRKVSKKMRDQARKANSKRHRKRRKRSYTLYYIFVLFLILVTGITLSVTVFFNIQTIEVTGGSQYTAQQLSSYAGVSEGDNLFRLNLKKMRGAVLEQTTDLDDVSIRRNLPETLSFELVPAVPEAVVLFSGHYYILSSGARIIQVADTLEGYEQLLQISGIDLSDYQLGDFLDQNETYQTVQQILDSIDSSKLDSVQGISVSKDTDIYLNYENRIAVSLGSMLEISDKLALASQIIAENVGPSETGILDVSRLGTAYFRPKTVEEMSGILPPGGALAAATDPDVQAEPQPEPASE